ncbi:hypothetical protein BJV74DRAFT_885213 [Russula compacta]|nr:hypothetical protein BJV74DRAFT_885213 [Russula compacta]
MSPRSTKIPSKCVAQCPDCGVTLSRQADMNRHRRTRHSNGTEIKHACPWPGCQYKTLQKGNLKTHLNARHSDRRQYPCPDCDHRFTDAAARIRHRKKTHGYEPYHTAEYLSRTALRKAEEGVQGSGKAVSSKSYRQRAANAAPYTLPDCRSSGALLDNVPEAAYHDDLWKTLVNSPHHAPGPQCSPDVQLDLPSVAIPGHNTPEALQPLPNFSPLLQPLVTSLDLTSDDSGFSGPQFDAYCRFSRSIGLYSSSLPPAFPALDGLLDYLGVDFMNHPQGFPMDSYSDVSSISSSTPDAFDLELPFIPINKYEPASLGPAPGPSWTPTLSPAISTPLSQFDFFMPEQFPDFDFWCQSNVI